MSNGAEEIENISKRLAELERAIGELRAGDLALIKTIAAELCEMYYTIFTLFHEGEEVEKYTELWTKRLAETKHAILGSETSEAVIGTRDKFVTDLADYAKAATDSAAKTVEKAAERAEKAQKVEYVEEAMDIANAFMKKDNPVALPLKAVMQDDVWVVDVDIGAVRMEIVRVKIDANTGNILGHEIVERK